MHKPLFRWTIGQTTSDGYKCLLMSIDSVMSRYDGEAIVCYNCDPELLPKGLPCPTHDQRTYQFMKKIPAQGVAWKLYPPRFDLQRHEIQIDNDLVLTDRLEEIDYFLQHDCTLLLEDCTRTYGRFEKYVPRPYQINSGLFGVPPGLDLVPYIDFYAGVAWEANALGEHKENYTFDEQGLIAFALLKYPKHVIIPATTITNCEHVWKQGKGCHFVGLNRRDFHQPFRLYNCRNAKIFL